MKPFSVAILALTLALTACHGGELTKIPSEKMKPGADFYFDLPELGMSSRLASKNERKPVQMRVILPTNYRADKPHPVIVHEGGGQGWIDEIAGWKDCLNGLNFILFSVDYSDELKFRDQDFKHALYGLDVIDRSTAIDRGAVFVSGISSGSYGVTAFYRGKEANAFSGFIIMIGGDLMTGPPGYVDPAPVPKGRPVLQVAGEKDLDKASNGVERVVAQQRLHEVLLKNGVDAEFIMQPGAGHEWKADSYPAIRDWIYRKLPGVEMARMNLYSRLADKTALDWRKKWYYQRLAESWLETPTSAKARQVAK